MNTQTELPEHPEQPKAIWVKPTLEVCELNQTQSAFGSVGDGSLGTSSF